MKNYFYFQSKWRRPKPSKKVKIELQENPEYEYVYHDLINQNIHHGFKYQSKILAEFEIPTQTANAYSFDREFSGEKYQLFEHFMKDLNQIGFSIF